jgi:hypothetical protein
MDVAEIILWAVGSYLLIGAAVATPFVWLGVDRVDEAAAGAPVLFRILIWPGSVALWPVVLHWLLHPRGADHA